MRCPECGEHKYAIRDVCCSPHKPEYKHLYKLTMACIGCKLTQDYFGTEAERVQFIYNNGNQMKQMKFAIDIHGVIDQNPKFWRRVCKSLVRGGIEVHILTGKHLSNGIHEELLQLGFLAFIHYTDIFSIADYHKEKGTKMWGDEKNPWMADADWDRTKADYCRREKIDFCLDDKEQYMKYFLTPVALYHSHTMKLAGGKDGKLE